MSVNSVFNGIAISIDMIEENPEKIRLFALRSFGETLYHSITDACLEYGYSRLKIKLILNILEFYYLELNR